MKDLCKRVIDGMLELAEKERNSVAFNFSRDGAVEITYQSGTHDILEILARLRVFEDGRIEDPYDNPAVKEFRKEYPQSSFHVTPSRQGEILKHVEEYLFSGRMKEIFFNKSSLYP